MTKPRILFLTPLPPPLHGVSYLNDYLLKSKRIYNAFDIDIVRINPVQNYQELGHVTCKKLIGAVPILFRVLRASIMKHDLVYFENIFVLTYLLFF